MFGFDLDTTAFEIIEVKRIDFKRIDLYLDFDVKKVSL